MIPLPAQTLLLTLVLAAPAPLAITTVHQSVTERQTQVQLERLLAAHDTSAWTFTRTLAIDEDAIPHSHPVLTLHTRHLKDDALLLSTYVHEQLHWFLDAHPAETAAAVKELKVLWPKVPVGFPDGAMSETSTYEHLLVCALEDSAVRQLLGELAAFQVVQFWATDHYRWVYRRVLEDGPRLRTLLKAHGLVVPQA